MTALQARTDPWTCFGRSVAGHGPKGNSEIADMRANGIAAELTAKGTKYYKDDALN